MKLMQKDARNCHTWQQNDHVCIHKEFAGKKKDLYTTTAITITLK